MKALVTTGAGTVELREAPAPVPAAGEVLVAVRAVSVNRGELRVAGGAAGVVPGWDVAGELLEDAPSAGLARGAAVVALVDGGAWAETVAVRLDRLAAIPRGVTPEQAATLPVAGLTALQALRIGGSLIGRRVLITGAAGGVGRFAVQLARLSGAHVTAVARDGGRAAGLAELGADEVVTGIEQLAVPFDLILESVGGGSLTRALALLAPGGDLVSFGGSCDRPGVLDPRALFNSAPGARIHAYQVFEVPSAAADLAVLLELVGSGRLDPQVERVAGWTDAEPLLRALAERRVNGKAVLRITPSPERSPA